MAYYKKSLKEISDNLQADFQSSQQKLPNRRDLISTLIKVLAGASYSWHAQIEYVLNQSFLDTADEENLIKKGQMFGIERKAAVRASGQVQFTTSRKPIIIPVGTILQTSDGYKYRTTSSFNGDDLKVQVTALLAGAQYNLQAGAELSLTNPIDGVQGAIVKDTGITGGVDIETIEALRERIRFRLQNPPRCGTVGDYIAWAQEVAGVTRSWCQRNTPVEGQVTVRIMTDELTEDGFPTEAKIQEVQDYIDERSPTEATVIVAKPLKKVINIHIEGLDPNTSDNQQKIKTRLKELFYRQSTLSGVITWNRINATITNTVGVDFFTLTEPTTDVTAAAHELAVLGDVAFGN